MPCVGLPHRRGGASFGCARCLRAALAERFAARADRGGWSPRLALQTSSKETGMLGRSAGALPTIIGFAIAVLGGAPAASADLGGAGAAAEEEGADDGAGVELEVSVLPAAGVDMKRE